MVPNMQNSALQDLEQLRQIHTSLAHGLTQSRGKNQNQKTIYRDLIKTFHLFSKELETLCGKINDQITRAQITEEYENSTYQFLSNSLLRLSECARRVAAKCRNEVLQPFTLFTQNYAQLSTEEIGKVEQRINNLRLHQQELQQQRQNYRLANVRLQKQKEQQTKMMLKIESNTLESQNQLTKFNQNIKKMVQNISLTEKFYLGAIEKTNYEWIQTKEELQKVYVALSYNEQSRNSFCRKNAINCIKSLVEFRTAVDQEAERKIQESGKNLVNEKTENEAQKKLKIRIQLLLNSSTEERYISYEEEKRQQRKKMIMEEENHLAQLFEKIKPQQKQIIEKYVECLFQRTFTGPTRNTNLVVSQYFDPQQGEKPENQSYHPIKSQASYIETQNVKQQDPADLQIKKVQNINEKNAELNTQIQGKQHKKDCSKYSNSKKKGNLQWGNTPSGKGENQFKVQYYQETVEEFKKFRPQMLKNELLSFYFVENLYLKIVEMSSIYLKLEEDLFTALTKDMLTVLELLNVEKQKNETHVEFLYKILIVSQRVVKKRLTDSFKNHQIQLLCQFLARGTRKLHNPRVISKLFSFLVRKKEEKKRQGKGVINSLTKGFFAVMTGKKDPLLTTDEHFCCIQELANIMSYLEVPTGVSLPLLKELLGPNNQEAFQYLKSSILTKKDTAERQKIQFHKTAKEKEDENIALVRKNKALGEFCIFLTARKGFFGYKEVKLRELSRNFKNIHQEILHKTSLPTALKWPRMAPISHDLDYQQLFHTLSTVKNQSTDEIIGLDVNRSLHMHALHLKPQILTRILRVYAYSHPLISYCQGMNYIAGYLFIKTGKEDVCYKLFEHLMETRFKELFANEFEELRIKMYQFERLLAIYHPQISEHFKRHSVLPECYIISWIITLFASCYQYTLQSFLIDTLWERFIIWGWPEFFRFVLWLFSLFKNQLIEMGYDKALHFFSDLLKSTLFLAGNQQFAEKHPSLTNFQEHLESFQVSDELLQTLRKQFFLV